MGLKLGHAILEPQLKEAIGTSTHFLRQLGRLPKFNFPSLLSFLLCLTCPGLTLPLPILASPLDSVLPLRRPRATPIVP